MDGRKLNVISHVSLTSRQLRDLAEEVEMPFLTYLLGMVILEAEKALQDGRRNDGICNAFGCRSGAKLGVGMQHIATGQPAWDFIISSV